MRWHRLLAPLAEAHAALRRSKRVPRLQVMMISVLRKST